ncbi:hypothetical protein M3J09_000999 [Ascochyta lentis]
MSIIKRSTSRPISSAFPTDIIALLIPRPTVSP